MRTTKRKRLEAAGWRVGSVEEFLSLDAVDAALVELKLALGSRLRRRRAERGVTQSELARRVGSSQSRVAKMEAADPSVSIDLVVRSLLALGDTPSELEREIARAAR